MTLVLTSLLSFSVFQLIYIEKSSALPDTGFQPTQIDPSTETKKNKRESNVDLSESTQITPTLNPPSELEKYKEEEPLLPTRKISAQANFLGMGIWAGSVIDNSGTNNLYIISFGKTFHEELDKGHEYGIQLSNAGHLGWMYNLKWLQKLGVWYEPYYKAGIGALYLSSENLGTFINWNRYQLYGGVGLDDLLKKQQHLRTEAGISWCGNGLGYYLNFTIAF